MSGFGAHSTGPEVVAAFASQIEGKTIVITGPSAGSLGAQSAIYLAAGKPKTFILLGRSISKIQPVIDEIATVSPNTKTHFVPLDLASLPSVRAAATSVRALTSTIDILLNNAGIMALPTYQTSPDGIELQFATNHLGHFLLTALLSSLLVSGSRVVNVSSAGHALGRVRFEDVNFNEGKDYDAWQGYSQGKAANILFAKSLAKKLAPRDIQAFSLHPGTIFGTGLSGNLVDPDWPEIMKLFAEAGRPVPAVKSLPEGCATIIAACIDPNLKDVSGAYLDDCQVGDPAAFAIDDDNAEKLWELSEKLVGEKFQI